MKRYTALLLVLLLTCVAVGNNYEVSNAIETKKVIAESNIKLTPDDMSEVGITTDTTFTIEGEGLTLEGLKKGLIMEPEVPFTLTKKGSKFVLTLEEKLKAGALYTFSYKANTWTYQTLRGFALRSTLPTNEAVSVPLNSGIEFYFTEAGVNLDNHFEVTPEVKGKFETKGNTVIFMPEEKLKEETIYTVTVKKGLTVSDSENSLKEDYVFKFETMAEKDWQKFSAYFNFGHSFYNFSSVEVPTLDMDYWFTDEEKARGKDMAMSIYAFNSMNQFKETLDDYYKIPFWSEYGEKVLSTENMKKVMSFETPLQLDTYERYVEFPDTLPKGIYLVVGRWEDEEFQTFIQVTDISTYYLDSTTGGLLWLNDLSTGKKIEGAKVKTSDKKTLTSNQEGIVSLPKSDTDKRYNLYEISYMNENAVLINQETSHTYGYSQPNAYWKVIHTDRSLYQPDDTVNFWGFIKDREGLEKFDKVTVTIEQGGWYFPYGRGGYYGESTPLITEEVAVKNGFYEGQIELPYLEKGSYQLSIKSGDRILAQSYVEVDRYIKPAYKMEISKDKNAVFIGEPVSFDVKTLFFEGTPVSHLDVNYQLNGYGYLSNKVQSDKEGNVKVTYTPNYVKDTQGIRYSYLYANSLLPESGEIYGDESIRVFVNDVNMKTKAESDEGINRLSVQMDTITLDRLNNGTAEDNMDFLNQPFSNSKVEATVYQHIWVKKKVGQHYDYINKIMVDDYNYEKKTTELQSFLLTTDAKGYAEETIEFPEGKDYFYSVKFVGKDKQGRQMTYENYFFEKYYSMPVMTSERKDITLKNNQEEYSIGDKVLVDFMEGEEKLKADEFLFVLSANGIKEYEQSQTATFVRTYTENYMPNVEVRAIAFDGKDYIVAPSTSINYKKEDRNIEITATLDKEQYKPGGVVTLSITGEVEKEGMKSPLANGQVNISLVDEALLALRDYKIDTLEELYAHVPSGITVSVASHNNVDNLGLYFGGYRTYGLEKEEAAMADTANMKVTGADVRSNFKDTALFQSIELDENGKGKLTFQLPDNITSWRLMLAGLSEDLYAGSNIEEVKVTMPFFININTNTSYLNGDKPSIGVSAYGDLLNEKTEIIYELSCKETGYKTSITGKAFTKAFLPINKLDEGQYTFVLQAKGKGKVNSNLKDAVEFKVNVKASRLMVESARSFKAVEGLTFENGQEGLTKLMFIDEGKGKFLPTLYQLSYTGGRRVDQVYVASKAQELIKSLTDDDFLDNNNADIMDYFEQGGISLLPYSAIDLSTTVKMLPLMTEEGLLRTMSNYLYAQKLEPSNMTQALYGLSYLREPVLVDLATAEKVEPKTFEDYIYLALAYASIGDKEKAADLYNAHIASEIEVYDDMARVVVGKTEEDYLFYTSKVMLLSSLLDLDIKEELYAYVSNNYSSVELYNAELLTYIQKEIQSLEETEGKITYTYDGKSYDVVLNGGWGNSIDIPSVKLDDFQITGVEGDIAIVIVDDISLKDAHKVKDKYLTIEKKFVNYATGETTTTFNTSDIVKVVIDPTIDKNAMDDYYVVRDYAPSGLKPISNPVGMGVRIEDTCYRHVDDQMVTFYVSKNRKMDKPLYYYARVVTPGEYVAEGTLMQGSYIKDSIAISEGITIKIED